MLAGPATLGPVESEGIMYTALCSNYQRTQRNLLTSRRERACSFLQQKVHRLCSETTLDLMEKRWVERRFSRNGMKEFLSGKCTLYASVLQGFLRQEAYLKQDFWISCTYRFDIMPQSKTTLQPK